MDDPAMTWTLLGQTSWFATYEAFSDHFYNVMTYFGLAALGGMFITFSLIPTEKEVFSVWDVARILIAIPFALGTAFCLFMMMILTLQLLSYRFGDWYIGPG